MVINRNKALLLIVSVLAVFAASVFFLRNSQKNLLTVKVNNSTIFAKIAKNNLERAKGLMYVKALKENHGMLFIYPDEKYHSFWMKNTLIPLDMLWIDSNHKIVAIYQNAQPCKTATCESIMPPHVAKYVLEVNGGWSAKNNISIGDMVEFKEN